MKGRHAERRREAIANGITLVRAIVVATDGKRYMTGWRRNTPLAQLGPDEMPAWHKCGADAQKLVKRKKLTVKQIDAQFLHPKKDHSNVHK